MFFLLRVPVAIEPNAEAQLLFFLSSSSSHVYSLDGVGGQPGL